MAIAFKQENKKVLFIAVVIIAVACLLLQFVYLPKAGEVKRLALEYREIKKNLDELYSFMGGEEGLKDNIVKMREELALLEEAFPNEKEVSNIIKRLNDEARRFNIKVSSFRPSDLSAYDTGKGVLLSVSSYTCKRMPLTLNLVSRYRSLGEFLIDLESNRDPAISIEKVEITKNGNAAPNVNASVELSAYLLGR